MTDRQTQDKIDARIRDYHSVLCEQVRKGEITDVEANILAAGFADRMYSQGPWG